MGPFCRVYVGSLSPRRTCLPIDVPTSCFHVLARLSSHHPCEVARCWIRVSTLCVVKVVVYLISRWQGMEPLHL